VIRAAIVAALLALSSTALAAKGHRPPGPPEVAGVVNINEASAKQIALLPGVGPSRAKAIVAYRKGHPFARTEDLRQVKGVGKGIMKKIARLVSVKGPSTLAKVKTP